MTTQDHATIDLVGFDRRTDTVLLVMVEPRSWGSQGLLLPDIQEKVNTYLVYVMDGQLVADYPIAAGKQVRFELRCSEPPDEREKEFLEIVRRKHLDPLGISFEWKEITSDA